MFIAALRGKTVNSRKPFSSTAAARGQNGFENGTNSLLSGHTHHTLAIYITFYVFFFLSFHKTPNGYMPVATICTPYTPYILLLFTCSTANTYSEKFLYCLLASQHHHHECNIYIKQNKIKTDMDGWIVWYGIDESSKRERSL